MTTIEVDCKYDYKLVRLAFEVRANDQKLRLGWGYKLTTTNLYMTTSFWLLVDLRLGVGVKLTTKLD